MLSLNFNSLVLLKVPFVPVMHCSHLCKLFPNDISKGCKKCTRGGRFFFLDAPEGKEKERDFWSPPAGGRCVSRSNENGFYRNWKGSWVGDLQGNPLSNSEPALVLQLELHPFYSFNKDGWNSLQMRGRSNVSFVSSDSTLNWLEMSAALKTAFPHASFYSWGWPRLGRVSGERKIHCQISNSFSLSQYHFHPFVVF